jgi:hypothetical protein
MSPADPPPTLFGIMAEGQYAGQKAEKALAEILGIEILGIGFDTYDWSFEIFPMEDVAEVAVSDAQHKAILELGCLRYWINFPDGTEQYGQGSRRHTGQDRWQEWNKRG